VPGAENQITQVCERDKFPDARDPIISPLAQTNRAHLSEAADRFGQSVLDCFDSRDERRANGAQSNQQNSQFSFCRRDFRAFLYRHSFASTSETINDVRMLPFRAYPLL